MKPFTPVRIVATPASGFLSRSLIATGVGLLIWAAAASGQTYHLTDLGTLSGGTAWGSQSHAYGINATGQVVGKSESRTNSGLPLTHAFLYSGGSLTDLGTLGDNTSPGYRSVAYGINSGGQVVGFSDVSNSMRAFLYSNGVMKDLGTLGGWSYATAINIGGQVVGVSARKGWSGIHAFIYSAGTMRDLGTLGGSDSAAFAINDSGKITGSASTKGNKASHAFLYDGTMHDLGSLGGSSTGYGINASGQVVGESFLAGVDLSHAFLYSAGLMTDLGTLGGSYTRATAINAAGQIVGHSNGRAFLYTGGVMKDLSTLLDFPGRLIFDATGINDAGWIVGTGSGLNGNQHAFLLTPVP